MTNKLVKIVDSRRECTKSKVKDKKILLHEIAPSSNPWHHLRFPRNCQVIPEQRTRIDPLDMPLYGPTPPPPKKKTYLSLSDYRQ